MKWGMSRQRAMQLMDAAETMTTVVVKSAITTESQARELSRVEPEKRQWQSRSHCGIIIVQWTFAPVLYRTGFHTSFYT